MAPHNIEEGGPLPPAGPPFLSDAVTDTLMYGFIFVYLAGIFGFIFYKVRQQKRIQKTASQSLEGSLDAAYPDAEQRRLWLVKQQLKANFHAAFPYPTHSVKKQAWLTQVLSGLTSSEGAFKDEEVAKKM